MKKIYYRQLAFMGVLILALLAFERYTGSGKEDFSDVRFLASPTPSSYSAPLTEFDPNDLDARQWQLLGFTGKQAATILNYKKVVGGTFVSKQQLKKCFAVSEEKFRELEKYMLLPETAGEAGTPQFTAGKKNTVSVSVKFNPDLMTAGDWEEMGFSEKQARAILKYKDYLGGSFVSKEKFRECFIISKENFRKLSPYLLLPEKTPEDFRRYAGSQASGKKRTGYHPFDPNALDAEGWKALGFSEKQAGIIIHYRDRNLGGRFRAAEDLQRCFVVSPEKFEEMKPYIRLAPPGTLVPDTKQAAGKQQETDFSKTDLNTITFRQLVEFGLDEKSAGSIIGFRRKLGGFMTKDQILTTYNIDTEKVKKLLTAAPLTTAGVPRYNLSDAPEEWLRNHPYFKYSADKIIFYRLSEKDERKIWKLLKLKPEYEARMKLYLK